MRVLELGNYIAPAYAGMILAEQGHTVVKWLGGRPDPILELKNGQAFFEWLNDKKYLQNHHAKDILKLRAYEYDVVIDNFKPSTLVKWEIDPAQIARNQSLTWVSLRSEVGEMSFDVIAQARSWMEYSPWVPFYAGDTIAGLWLAFKAMAQFLSHDHIGHSIIGHASCLQKLVEGELLDFAAERPRLTQNGAWDALPYRADESGATVEYHGETLNEPVRDRAWKLAHLYHELGRIQI